MIMVYTEGYTEVMEMKNTSTRIATKDLMCGPSERSSDAQYVGAHERIHHNIPHPYTFKHISNLVFSEVESYLLNKYT
jgi:hypothetical protein